MVGLLMRSCSAGWSCQDSSRVGLESPAAACVCTAASQMTAIEFLLDEDSDWP